VIVAAAVLFAACTGDGDGKPPARLSAETVPSTPLARYTDADLVADQEGDIYGEGTPLLNGLHVAAGSWLVARPFSRAGGWEAYLIVTGAVPAIVDAYAQDATRRGFSDPNPIRCHAPPLPCTRVLFGADRSHLTLDATGNRLAIYFVPPEPEIERSDLIAWEPPVHAKTYRLRTPATHKVVRPAEGAAIVATLQRDDDHGSVVIRIDGTIETAVMAYARQLMAVGYTGTYKTPITDDPDLTPRRTPCCEIREFELPHRSSGEPARGHAERTGTGRAYLLVLT
jgi:hypothetical protein